MIIPILFWLLTIPWLRAQDNLLTGTVYHDLNIDCIQDIGLGELGLAGLTVKLTPGPQYAVTDAEGNYSFTPANGNYTIEVLQNNPLWKAAATCNVQLSATVGGTDTLHNLDLAQELLRTCQNSGQNWTVPGSLPGQFLDWF